MKYRNFLIILIAFIICLTSFTTATSFGTDKSKSTTLLALTAITAKKKSDTTKKEPEIIPDPSVRNKKIDGESLIPVSAEAAVVIDAKNGNVLYSKNGELPYYPASCTKILAVIVAIERGNINQKLTVSDNAVYNIDKASSHIALNPGEVITLEQALYGMLLASGNDCSVAVAEGLAGSTDKFSNWMNEKASEIGCINSNFANPHGLYADNHYTTPLDMARIMKYCISDSTFLKIDKTIKYTIPPTNKSKEARELWNNHRMIENKYCYYAPVIGGKSGYIEKSKFNLITYGQKDGIKLIVVVMKGENPTNDCTDTKNLMEWYFTHYKNYMAQPNASKFSTINYNGDEVPIKFKKSFPILLPKGINPSKIRYTTVIEKKDGSASKGEVIGTLRALYDGKILGTTPIIAQEATGIFSTIIKPLIFGMLIAAVVIVILLLCLRIYFKSRPAIKRNKTYNRKWKKPRRTKRHRTSSRRRNIL